MSGKDEERRNSFDVGLLIIPLLFLLQTGYVSPFHEFPINDDWLYALLVKNFYEKGIFKIASEMSANCVFHTFWGWIFTLPFGFSFSALRISTLLLHLMGSLAFYRLLRELKFPIVWSLFSTLLLIFNPWIFNLSYSFMTDIPYLSFLAVGVFFYYKGVFEDKNPCLWLGSISSSISFLIREMGILLPISVCIYLTLYDRRFLKGKIFAILGVPLAVLAGFEYWYVFIHGVTEGHKYHRDTMLHNLMNTHIGIQFFERSIGVLYFLGLTLLPLAPLILLPLRRRIFHLKLNKRIFLAILLFFILMIGMWRCLRGAYAPLDSLWMSGSFLGVMEGAKPRVIPTGGEEILFGVSVVSACILFSWLYLAFAESDWTKKGEGMFIMLLGLVQFGYLLVAPFFFQRYFVPFLPFVVLAISLSIGNSAMMRSLKILLPLSILVFFSLLTTKDSLSWNQAKWTAARRLVRQGVPMTQIEAGIEWDGWNSYEYSKTHQNEKRKRYYPVPWWLVDLTPAIDPIYKLSFSELEGYELFDKWAYHSPFYKTPQEIFVLVRKPTQTIEGFEDRKKDFTTGWNHNLDSNMLELNQERDFISEGTMSLRCEIKTNSIDTFHYGGVRIKTAMNTVGFIFDLWLLNPKNVKKIFVYCYDGNGNLTAKWFRDVIMTPVREREKNTFYFLFGLSQDGFEFAGGSGGKTDYVDIFMESDKENARMLFYIDNFRA